MKMCSNKLQNLELKIFSENDRLTREKENTVVSMRHVNVTVDN